MSRVEVAIWAWPRDPALPALAAATNPVLLAEVFRDFGLSTASTLDIRARRYRPARHAVLEVSDGRFRWFVKVVRPSAVADLCYRHEVASRTVPVPPVLGSTPAGLIVLAEAQGTPSPEALESVLDALPAELMTLAPVPSHLRLVDYHAGELRCAAADEPAVHQRHGSVRVRQRQRVHLARRARGTD